MNEGGQNESSLEGNVVKEFMIGNTTVKICDDFCRDKTPEDIRRMLKEIADNAYPALRAKHEREVREKKVRKQS